MSKPATVSHQGVVSKIDGRHIAVVITSESACSACHAEGACSMSGKKEKIIDITGSYNLKEGDSVIVQMEKSLGYSAIIIGYLIPLITVIATLVIFLALNFKESHAGIFALLSIFIYYIFLLLYRKKINSKFIFSLKAL
ncbi:MAG: SoxR reducing system RseC family protein [Bacteroidales bacterium]|jgi:sigma-E factor negative regulatory protein RseC|nr:SoxR reducing system RseC family protein [Bacteroidales bacterium]